MAEEATPMRLSVSSQPLPGDDWVEPENLGLFCLTIASSWVLHF